MGREMKTAVRGWGGRGVCVHFPSYCYQNFHFIICFISLKAWCGVKRVIPREGRFARPKLIIVMEGRAGRHSFILYNDQENKVS